MICLSYEILLYVYVIPDGAGKPHCSTHKHKDFLPCGCDDGVKTLPSIQMADDSIHKQTDLDIKKIIL